MVKWGTAVRVDAIDILRNRSVYRDDVIVNHAGDTKTPSYAFVSGWHFYAYLDIPSSREECEDVDDEHIIALLYHAYTLAARRVVSVFGDRSELLEHQGSLLHFHLQLDAYEIDMVKVFGHLLATFVNDDVMKHARNRLRFSMAAEHGICCILRVPSVLAEDSSYSRVSLGPCANNPAKKLLGTNDICTWRLAYRASEKETWLIVDCGADDFSRERIRRYGLQRTMLNSDHFAVHETIQNSIDSVDDVPYSSAKRVFGYVFRADLDGFTRKVHEAFSNGCENDASAMAESFISFMEEVNNWQEHAWEGVRFITCPWAGDCCTIIVGFTDRNDEYDMVEARKQLSTFPVKMVNKWEDGLSKCHRADGLGAWTFSIALGHTRVFTETVDGTPYRLMVGWPSFVSHEGVNATSTCEGDLIMHHDDVAEMIEPVQNSFGRLSVKFCRQSEEARKEMIRFGIDSLGENARSTSFHSFRVPMTRSYFVNEREAL